MAKKVGKSQRIQTVTLVDLTGGMNVAKSPEFLKQNECVNLDFLTRNLCAQKTSAI